MKFPMNLTKFSALVVSSTFSIEPSRQSILSRSSKVINGLIGVEMVCAISQKVIKNVY